MSALVLVSWQLQGLQAMLDKVQLLCNLLCQLAQSPLEACLALVAGIIGVRHLYWKTADQNM